MTRLSVPPLTSFAAAPLQPLPRAASASPVPAGSLWEKGAAVVMVVRRPGCQLCRAEAMKLHSIQPQLEACGVRLVAVVHEELPEQIAEFKGEFWPGGELYLDSAKAFYGACGGGEVRRGALSSFFNPFSRIWKNVKASEGVKGNLVGDGLLLGGLLVVRKGGEVEYAFQEKTFGDYAPPEEVLEAARAAARA